MVSGVATGNTRGTVLGSLVFVLRSATFRENHKYLRQQKLMEKTTGGGGVLLILDRSPH